MPASDKQIIKTATQAKRTMPPSKNRKTVIAKPKVTFRDLPLELRRMIWISALSTEEVSMLKVHVRKLTKVELHHERWYGSYRWSDPWKSCHPTHLEPPYPPSKSNIRLEAAEEARKLLIRVPINNDKHSILNWITNPKTDIVHVRSGKWFSDVLNAIEPFPQNLGFERLGLDFENWVMDDRREEDFLNFQGLDLIEEILFNINMDFSSLGKPKPVQFEKPSGTPRQYTASAYSAFQSMFDKSYEVSGKDTWDDLGLMVAAEMGKWLSDRDALRKTLLNTGSDVHALDNSLTTQSFAWTKVPKISFWQAVARDW